MPTILASLFGEGMPNREPAHWRQRPIETDKILLKGATGWNLSMLVDDPVDPLGRQPRHLAMPRDSEPRWLPTFLDGVLRLSIDAHLRWDGPASRDSA